MEIQVERSLAQQLPACIRDLIYEYVEFPKYLYLYLKALENVEMLYDWSCDHYGPFTQCCECKLYYRSFDMRLCEECSEYYCDNCEGY